MWKTDKLIPPCLPARALPSFNSSPVPSVLCRSCFLSCKLQVTSWWGRPPAPAGPSFSALAPPFPWAEGPDGRASTFLPRQHHPCPLVPASLLGRVTSRSPLLPPAMWACPLQGPHRGPAGLALQGTLSRFLVAHTSILADSAGSNFTTGPFPTGRRGDISSLGAGSDPECPPRAPGPTSGASPAHAQLP